LDILYLIDRLENLVTSSKRMPLVNQVIIKEADLLTIIEQLRASVPTEFKQARRINQERERILAQAQSEANNLVKQAKDETERAIAREGLLQIAEERSQEIIRRANEQAQMIVRRAERHTEQLQIEADNYAAETLRNLKEHLVQVETEIERAVMSEIDKNIRSIELGLESLEERPEEEEEVEEAEGGALNVQESAGPLAPAEAQPPAPRRASLAADTMGGPNYPTP
jgi:hypothetical protein